MKKQIPNILTLLNLACGTASIVFALEGQWQWAVFGLLVASLLDFLDGQSARWLNAMSRIGKQLDALSDMVSFGVLPAVMIYMLLKGLLRQIPNGSILEQMWMQWIIMASVLLVPLLSAIRLARFTAGSGDEPFFNGLPTPAHALFWGGIYWQLMRDGLLYGSPVSMLFLISMMVIMAVHMILPISMYSLKFEHFRIRGNLIRYLILISSLLILIFMGLPGLSLIILIYILLSLLNLLLQRGVSS